MLTTIVYYLVVIFSNTSGNRHKYAIKKNHVLLLEKDVIWQLEEKINFSRETRSYVINSDF